MSILNYIEKNNLNKIRELLDSGIDINKYYELYGGIKKEYPLIYACKNKKYNVVKLFLEYSTTNVNIQDSFGNNPLSESINYIDDLKIKYKIVKLLLNDPRIDVNIKNRHEETALHTVCFLNLIEIAKLFLKRKDLILDDKNDRGMTPLDLAIKNKGYDIILLLLKKSKINKNEYFFNVCKKADIDIVNFFLQNASINVNYRNEKKISCLDIACSNSNLEVIKILLNHPDIDVNIKNGINYKSNSLYYMCKYNHIEIVKLFLEHPDIDVNTINDFEKTTCLGNACFSENEEIVKLLLSHPKINVNIKNKYGLTPLHSAFTKSNTYIISLLLQRDDTIIDFDYKWHFTKEMLKNYKIISRIKKLNNARVIDLLSSIEE